MFRPKQTSELFISGADKQIQKNKKEGKHNEGTATYRMMTYHARCASSLHHLSYEKAVCGYRYAYVCVCLCVCCESPMNSE